MENVWFSITTCECAKWICRSWERQITDKLRLYAAFVLVVLFSRKSHMNGNHWQKGGMEVVTVFHLFSWPLMLFPRGCLPLGQQYPSLNRKPDLGFRFLISPEPVFRAEKRKKHARTLRERWAPKVSKMAAILIFLFSTIYYCTADILVSSDNYPTQEDSCRCNLALVWFSYGLLNVKKDFKAFDDPAACKQIASTGLLLSWTSLQKATI